MGLMELEVAQMEHHLRAAELEQRHRLRQTLQEREQQDGPGRAQTDWPLVTLRFGPFEVTLFRTVWLPSERRVRRSRGASTGLYPVLTNRQSWLDLPNRVIGGIFAVAGLLASVIATAIHWR